MHYDLERGMNSFKQQGTGTVNLLNVNDVDVGIITETEIPSSGHGDYNVKGYHSYLPHSHSEL
jgi:hypothetical protein